MVAIIEKTDRYITKKESEKLKQLYYNAYRTPVLTTGFGIDNSDRRRAYYLLDVFMMELADKYELELEKEGAKLKIGEGNELIYAIVN